MGLSSSSQKATGDLDAVVASAPVVFFDLGGCPYCAAAKEALDESGIQYKLIPIGPYKSVLKQRTGKSSAPSVWIKSTYIGGCNDGTEPWMGVKPMLRNGKFQGMLKESEAWTPS